MDQLVVGALQKGGINRHHRAHAFARQPGGKGQRVLLGNAHVVKAVREAAVTLDHARALAHGGGDGHQLGVAGRHIAQPLTKDMRECDFAAGSTHHP